MWAIPPHVSRLLVEETKHLLCLARHPTLALAMIASALTLALIALPCPYDPREIEVLCRFPELEEG